MSAPSTGRGADHDLHLLTGAYAADALTSAELVELEKHLECCAPCAREARELQETAARLAMAAALTPPPKMRQEVLASAGRIRQVRPTRRRRQPADAPQRATWPQWALTPPRMMLAWAAGIRALGDSD